MRTPILFKLAGVRAYASRKDGVAPFAAAQLPLPSQQPSVSVTPPPRAVPALQSAGKRFLRMHPTA